MRDSRDLTGIWLTPSEYAEVLRVTLETVEHWRKTGLGPSPVGRGSGRRYDLAEVQAYLTQHYLTQQRGETTGEPA